MKPDMTEDILIKYLLGECGEAEKHAVEAWISADSQNAGRLEQVKIILEAGTRLAKESPLTEAEAWARFKVLRSSGKRAPGSIHTLVPTGDRRWLQIAAAILIISGGSWLIYRFNGNTNQGKEKWVTLTAAQSVRVDTLPDGSVVHLNKNSAISFAADYKSHRVVRLIGEAFFEVKHDETSPFSVQAKDILIKDIGTAFNVRTDKLRTEVIVESGIVSVSRNKAVVKINAMEKVVVSSGDQNLKVESNRDQLYNYYRTKKFFANNTPLRRLVEVINEAYGANIKISNKVLSETPITVTLKLEDPLQNVLKILKETTPEMKVDTSGSEIILR